MGKDEGDAQGDAYERRTELMNVRIGINVTLVLLPARERRNVVAADTGDAKFSYSSAGRNSCVSLLGETRL